MTMSLAEKKYINASNKKISAEILEVKYLDFVIMSYLTFLKLR